MAVLVPLYFSLFAFFGVLFLAGAEVAFITLPAIFLSWIFVLRRFVGRQHSHIVVIGGGMLTGLVALVISAFFIVISQSYVIDPANILTSGIESAIWLVMAVGWYVLPLAALFALFAHIVVVRVRDKHSPTRDIE
ncbi:MAG: hypothetical protein COB90_00715 [Hyphomicrobiales bacterium]|nr:MAG: hypothetical protein COB90_00715 [Hyphomicrobiales bacterium]